MKALSFAFAISLLSLAPFQCGSKPSDDPDLAREDNPSGALWTLAERFRTEGNEEARRTTLAVILEEYPRSREAERARMVLEEGREVRDPETTSGDELPAEGEAERSGSSADEELTLNEATD